ncbi:MAG: rhodanese-like domain-containing protein [Gammaproteobacteria bacterium]|nr:rhodanese-like domain-containing protein [Gammaproteobacteria bacterium]MDH3507648.1 rhodanese-like domain-containing protein [Gammaproteobacteria bacterium]
MPNMPEELSPTSLCARWPDERLDDVQLLDVREPEELAIASLPGSLHIPMREIPGRLEQLDRDRPIVVMCHTGVRSRHVAGFLLANDFKHVYNLAGGIDAWSAEIDPALPRY